MIAYLGLASGAEAIVQRAAAALLSGLWESAVLVAGVALLLKAVPRMTAAARFAIWSAVFFVSAVMPFADAFPGRAGGATVGGTAYVRFHEQWSYWIAGFWLMAVLLRLVQLVAQGWKLLGIWRRATQVPDEVLTGLACGDLPISKGVSICISDDVDRPSVIGFISPKILVPAWLFEQISAVELRHIVLHEMEHLRRRDDWINLLQRIGLAVLPLNPLLFWVDRKMAAERELACDDGVVKRTKMPRAYANCLASIAERRLERKMHRRLLTLALGVVGAAGMLRGKSEFSRRIESILSPRTTSRPTMAGALAAVMMAAILFTGAELVRAPRMVSFAPESGGWVGGAGNAGSSAGLQPARADGARVQQVSFRAEEPAPVKSVHHQLKAQVKQSVSSTDVPRRWSKSELVLDDHAGSEARVRQTRQWMVLTSVDEEQPARVVVRLDDGRFYVAPYAAVPVREGWLIFQL